MEGDEGGKKGWGGAHGDEEGKREGEGKRQEQKKRGWRPGRKRAALEMNETTKSAIFILSINGSY